MNVTCPSAERRSPERKTWHISPDGATSAVHAPQYIQAGLALDKPLMEWVRDSFQAWEPIS